MVRDVVSANVLPKGALSLLVGGIGDLLAHLDSEDVVAFTGSSDTAARVRGHPNIVARNIAVNIESDSLNAAVLAPEVKPGSAVFDAFVREVVREMTIKAGQKCTAIRRIVVPADIADKVAEAITGKLRGVTIGDPRQEGVQLGPLVTRAQQAAAFEGIKQLAAESKILCGGFEAPQLDGIDRNKSAFVAPTLLFTNDAMTAQAVHGVEVFGPAATIVPYRDQAEAFTLVRRGAGSLVASVFGEDPSFLAHAASEIASAHGRLLIVDAAIMSAHTGHGIVMPQCNHGGPGRAGNGEELGGLNGLRLYHQRVAIQGSSQQLKLLDGRAAPLH
jgi:3,4-dehydroadipyl-CoA semialdehyde dehydrogenase